jgi:heparan-alpha-glucosaminide N-acetyltransferase
MTADGASSLRMGRIASIDVFRGLTILVMVFVNDVHDVSGIPAWMRHMPASADGMTFVDVVFPAFLFIVGMSIPFSLRQRLVCAGSGMVVQQHILGRTLGLVVIGFFMVNAEDGFNPLFMALPISLWSLLSYACFYLIWGVYGSERPGGLHVLRSIGVLGLVTLALAYHGGPDGRQWMTPQYWGILGLIGWAYLIATVVYQLAGRSVIAVMIAVGLCVAYFATASWSGLSGHPYLAVPFAQGGNATHAAIVLCGVATSLVFFDPRVSRSGRRPVLYALAWAAALSMASYFLRPAFPVSKIYATPTWGLYSAAICIAVFSLLNSIVELGGVKRWARFVEPAAVNPLVTYLLPFVIEAVLGLSGVSLPSALRAGFLGVLWSATYTLAILGAAYLLNRWNVRLAL